MEEKNKQEMVASVFLSQLLFLCLGLRKTVCIHVCAAPGQDLFKSELIPEVISEIEIKTQGGTRD